MTRADDFEVRAADTRVRRLWQRSLVAEEAHLGLEPVARAGHASGHVRVHGLGLRAFEDCADGHFDSGARGEGGILAKGVVLRQQPLDMRRARAGEG